MFWPLALLLVAVAVFTAVTLVVRPGHRREVPVALVDLDVARSFLLGGAGALAALAVAVVVVGLLGRTDRAERLAVVGLFGFGLYLAVTLLLSGWVGRRR